MQLQQAQTSRVYSHHRLLYANLLIRQTGKIPKGPVEVKSKLGVAGAAGLAIAGVGTAAGVATVIQGSQGGGVMRSQTDTMHTQQLPNQSDGNNNEQQIDKNNNESSANGTTQSTAQATSANPEETTVTETATTEEYYYDNTDPLTDLSSFGNHYGAESSVIKPNPVADLAPIDPY